MTVLFLWRTVWEPFLEDSTSHRFMHPVEWRGGFHDMELFGKSKRAWLQTFLALPNGIPSHDTFGRLFVRLNPQRFQECFLSWPCAVSHLTQSALVSLDDKTVQASLDRAPASFPLHMLSAPSGTPGSAIP